MLRSYVIIAFRNMLRQKGYTALNLIGLSLGIACGLIILLHIKAELSYERNFPKYERIYWVSVDDVKGVNGWAKSSPPLGLQIQKDIPEIKSVARFFYFYSAMLRHGEVQAEERRGYFADSAAISMFDLRFLQGSPAGALSEPYTLVLTEKLARKYFGRENPVGKTIKVNEDKDYRVTGVIADLPEQTHLQFDYLVSVPTFYKNYTPEWSGSIGWMAGYTYVLFESQQAVARGFRKIPDFTANFYAPWGPREKVLREQKLLFMPIKDIHLRSHLEQEMGANGDIAYVYIFGAVAVLVLLIACVNFINLFTTQAIKRTREIGVRKMLGAGKGQLVRQLLGEAFLLTCAATLAAVFLYATAVPFYNRLTGRAVHFGDLFTASNLLILTGMMVLVGLLSGFYPAFLVSGFSPIKSLKGGKAPRSTAQLLRKGLVVFQFTLAIFMITCTLLISQQMHYFRNKDLGFDREQVVAIKLYGEFYDQYQKNRAVLKQELARNANILRVASTSNLVGDVLSVETVVPDNAAPDQQYPSMRVMRIDEDYLPTMGIPLTMGRNFSRQFNDSASFILNETAVKALGLKDPLGQYITNEAFDVRGKVVGVVKDFHFASLHNRVDPLVLEYQPEWSSQLLVKLKAGNPRQTLDWIDAKIKETAPGNLTIHTFLDERLNSLYTSEDNVSAVFRAFTLLAVVISCLGLLGLSAYATEVRIKEIGIRKVIGASVFQIVRLLSSDLLMLVVVGNLIAWPLAWYAIHSWLQHFAYRVPVNWAVYAGATGMALLVALLTVSYHSVRAALANPVNSLRSE